MRDGVRLSFDEATIRTKLAYLALRESGNEHVKLIIGPWGHRDRPSSATEFDAYVYDPGEPTPGLAALITDSAPPARR